MFLFGFYFVTSPFASSGVAPGLPAGRGGGADLGFDSPAADHLPVPSKAPVCSFIIARLMWYNSGKVNHSFCLVLRSLV